MPTNAWLSFILLVILCPGPSAAEWKAIRTENKPESGEQVRILKDGKLIARFLFGEGQLKPYLQLFGPNGESLNEWNPNQQFPHHRGIFIGWNRIRTELGSSDLWHLNKGERMVVTGVDVGTSDAGAWILAKVEWHAAPGSGETLLLRERRRLNFSAREEQTQVDAEFSIEPARDLVLDGDLQHAGVHFRGAHTVGARKTETAYVWDPDLPGPGGKVVSPDLKWARLIFPVEQKWFSATELNAPGNPVQELSWRDYGRFGFFFKKEMKKGEGLTLQYRFITEPANAPEGKTHLQDHRKAAGDAYGRYVRELRESN